MQSKIQAFFKPSLPAPKSPVRSSILDGNSDDELTLGKEGTRNRQSYTRRASKLHSEFSEVEVSKTVKNPISPKTPSEPDLIVKGKTINRKRSYAQLHLELGQSDFILRACPTFGVEYAPGNEDDEKGHKTFHKDFIHGIPFKGWRNERVIHMPSSEEGRIILVLDCDPPFQRIKVQEVIKRMEIELGGGWIYHSRCKRIIGCLVSEPIKEAFKVISSCEDGGSDRGSRKKKILNSRTLKFGEIIFQRETMKSSSSTTGHVEPNQSFSGAIFCERIQYQLFVALEPSGSLNLIEESILPRNCWMLQGKVSVWVSCSSNLNWHSLSPLQPERLLQLIIQEQVLSWFTKLRF